MPAALVLGQGNAGCRSRLKRRRPRSRLSAGWGGASCRWCARKFLFDGCHWNASGLAVALQSLQVGAQIGSTLVAQVTIFFESLVDDFFELGRKVGIDAHRGH